MARDWHEEFKSWAKPPTEIEEKKGSLAADMIRDALQSYPPLQNRQFSVYATGSYRNNTNVQLDSDIDVAIVLHDAVFHELPDNNVPSRQTLGLQPAQYGFDTFRQDVGVALERKVGPTGITPADKTFNVHESRRRLDADVTPFLLHRLYTGGKNLDGTWHYYEGVETRSRKDPGKRIINWHEQHYDEGVRRNEETGRRFKRITRILKRLRGEMREQGSASIAAAADPIPSFLIECLVFNAPDSCFNCTEGSYYEDVRATIAFLWNGSETDELCKDYVEVSRMKSLFSPAQPWSRDAVHEFLLGAWRHVGFK